LTKAKKNRRVFFRKKSRCVFEKYRKTY